MKFRHLISLLFAIDYLSLSYARPATDDDDIEDKLLIKRAVKRIPRPKNYDVIVQEAEEQEPADHKEVLDDDFTPRAGTGDVTLRWADYKMYIELDPDYTDSERESIEAAIYTLQEAMQCFEFRIVPHGKRLSKKVDSVYIQIQDGSCSSFLGRQGAQQLTYIGRGCNMYGTVMHELMHVLGFFHEQVRPDRDEFVDIAEDLPSRLAHQYKIRENQVYFADGYDFDSIMHYSLNDYMQPKPGMLPPGVKVGQRDHLSERDIIRLRGMYPCENAPKNKGK